MPTAKQGDTVRVHYTGTLEDGEVFDSSRQRSPLEFTLGQSQVIVGFERAIEGMSPGQSKSVEIVAAEAYGERDSNRVVHVAREQLPADTNAKIKVGLELQIQQDDGSSVPVIITELSESMITFDANHPLAGTDLTFEIELVEIV